MRYYTPCLTAGVFLLRLTSIQDRLVQSLADVMFEVLQKRMSDYILINSKSQHAVYSGSILTTNTMNFRIPSFNQRVLLLAT